MKKILVTGGSGFIGSNLIKYLIKVNKYDYIYSLDNYSSGSSKNHINNNKVKYIKGETENIFQINSLKNKKFDQIFHFAEFSRIVPSFKFYKDCWKSNMNGTFQVINFALKKKAKLIYSASSSTFGKNKYLSPYSWTKYINNENIKNFSKWFGLNYNIVYFYNVYGPGQIESGKMMAVIGIFEKQYNNKKPLTVVKPGTQKRDFTHVEDIVRGTYLAASKTNNTEFHIGSGKNYSIIQVAKYFKSSIKLVESRPGERFYSLSDSSNAHKILGYRPIHDLKNYISEFIKK